MLCIFDSALKQATALRLVEECGGSTSAEELQALIVARHGGCEPVELEMYEADILSFFTGGPVFEIENGTVSVYTMFPESCGDAG